MMTRTRSTWLLAMLLSLSIFAAPAAALAADELTVTTDRPEAIYSMGEPVRFQIQLPEKLADTDGSLSYSVTLDGFRELASGELDIHQKPLEVTASLDRPGFLRCTVTFAPTSSEGEKPVQAMAGAGIDPLKIEPSLPVPDDFDAFWARQKARVLENPAEPRLTEVESPEEGILVFDVQIDTPGPVGPGIDADGPPPVSAYFAKPADAQPRSLPAILFTHGAGTRSSILSTAVRGATWGALAMDINAHGVPNARSTEYYQTLAKGDLEDYRRRHRDDREQNYFLGMYLRLVRALEFLKSQPEWDGRTLVVHGSSQGGGQAIVAAGLDPDVTFFAANVPAMCDHTGFLADRPAGWPKIVPVSTYNDPDPQIIETVRYFDAMNFATRTTAQSILTAGFIDNVCPSTSVYATYNNLPEPKHIINRPLMKHEYPADLRAQIEEQIRAHMAANRSVTPETPE